MNYIYEFENEITCLESNSINQISFLESSAYKSDETLERINYAIGILIVLFFIIFFLGGMIGIVIKQSKKRKEKDKDKHK